MSNGMLTTERQRDSSIWVGVITLFPEMFQAISGAGITSRALMSGILQMNFWNPRDFTTDKHRTVDDKPYGGGPGMLMKVAPLKAAIIAAKTCADRKAGASSNRCKVIYLSPQGRPLTQKIINKLATERQLILVAGRYEGIDERLIEQQIDAEYSIGDYVLSGGELPAMVLIDSITRLQSGALGDDHSTLEESFADGLLEHPHYTRPEVVETMKVPDVLLSGNHKKIARWRLQQRLGRTLDRRPDLIAGLGLTEYEQNLLNEYTNNLARQHKAPSLRIEA